MNRDGAIKILPTDGRSVVQDLSVSPKGDAVAARVIAENDDVWTIDGDRKVQPFQATDADEWGPRFSPDGRWLAYVSNETAREEIFLRPIGSSGGRRQVSTGGGMAPVWARSGRELFFLKGEVDARRLIVRTVV